MYKIAILGCENTHANSFLRQIYQKGRHTDIEVIGIYSDEAEPCRKLNETFGVPVMERYDELVGKVDGIMVTARHGDKHYKYAKPYLASGIPMFIDKPVTVSGEEAVAFMREARANNVRICGSSVGKFLNGVVALSEKIKSGEIGTVHGGNVCAPIEIDSPYGGFYFYSPHLVQMMVTLFGGDVLEVSAMQQGRDVGIVATYRDYPITGSYVSAGGHFAATVYAENGIFTEPCELHSYAFEHQLDDMHDLLEGGAMKESYDSFIRPVFILEALERSLRSGKTEPVRILPV
jgi:predicted dehydrogenase